MSTSQSLTLSLFDGLKHTTPRPTTKTVAEWADFFYAHYSIAYSSKDSVPGFSPAEWSPGFQRGLAGIKAVHAVVLDLDEVLDLDVERLVASQLRGRQYLAYSTWGHPATRVSTPIRGKLRVVLPLSRSVTLDEWPGLWRRVAYHIGGGVARRVQGVRVEGSGLVDGACKDASHFYYLPSQPPGSPAPIFHHGGGGAR